MLNFKILKLMKHLNRMFAVALMATISVAGFSQVLMSSLADVDGNLNDASGVTTLSAANEYSLDTRIYVPDGHKLFIEAGTVIKAVSYPDPADAAALVVTRGGQIFALGTKSAPIVFTHEDDPLDGSFSVQNKELWGGIMVLGKAPNNIIKGEQVPEGGTTLLGNADGVGYIEGLNPPDVRHQYGATDTLPDGTPIFVEDDNSGVIRYVSIRHGGTEIGADNEINGLTLGSVGSGTTIDHIEVVSNGDDGIEFFGGTVDVKYVNVMFCEDDYIDWDQGYTGRIQFFFGLQLPEVITTVGGANNDTIQYGDNGMECDGDDGQKAGRPWQFSSPTVFNATIIGNGIDEGLELKERTEGYIANSIVANFNNGVRFNSKNGASEDDVPYPGAMEIVSNLFLNVNTNVDNVDPNADAALIASQEAALIADGNLFVTSSTIIDDEIIPSITDGIDGFANKFNAVPSPGAAEVATSVLPDFTDGFFEYAPYKGAFEPGEESWLINWTLHDTKGTGTIACPADVNGDRDIDVLDFNAVVGAYGTSCDQ
jgi:hypothetical protein